MTELIPIRVEVPVCAFRPSGSREYQDTFPAPPPSSVYGMLLSMLGISREDKACHRGAEMAIAVGTMTWERDARRWAFAPDLPGRSKVFRKLRRGSDLENARPDYQDLLIDLAVWIWLRPGNDPGVPPLSTRAPAALREPARIRRYGGLSLGESSYLVDTVGLDNRPPARLRFLVPDRSGFYALPTWVDHVERKNTVLERFRISEPAPTSESLASAWFRIG